jgi:Ankyrin repeats (3 copies)
VNAAWKLCDCRREPFVNAAWKLCDCRRESFVAAAWNSQACCLCCMCSMGHINLINLLLDHGASPLIPEALAQQTPLMMAAIMGHAAAVKLLVARGSDVQASMQLSALQTQCIILQGARLTCIRLQTTQAHVHHVYGVLRLMCITFTEYSGSCASRY